METRTDILETEVKTVAKQAAVQELQLSDIRWKLEEAENRQRRKNLRILGIKEGLEGQDTRAYIVSLFKKAFPDLVSWNWDKEIQRAHRFPLFFKKQEAGVNDSQKHPMVIIIYFGNFLLCQAVFEKASPNAMISVDGVSFYLRPDFVHATVERRWWLRTFIAPFQEERAEAYLLNPARLKILYKTSIRIFFLQKTRPGISGPAE
ncbi:hypothetical protein NDU88_005904 [Pleurodeles waltl]|uniref:Uncharacterized protein n=1 Tax=Pleurodeles waltl TaxID=8319 RepID=A0AAV7QM14_PLEWA|nr:hypothetical protein NDU88_005904 [Pleurodeles waltl]